MSEEPLSADTSWFAIAPFMNTAHYGSFFFPHLLFYSLHLLLLHFAGRLMMDRTIPRLSREVASRLLLLEPIIKRKPKVVPTATTLHACIIIIIFFFADSEYLDFCEI